MCKMQDLLGLPVRCEINELIAVQQRLQSGLNADSVDILKLNHLKGFRR